MGRKQKPDGFFNLTWNLFASVRLSVIVLTLLAVTSIIGTLVPQNQQPAFYFHKYGETLFRIFNGLNIFDMYHSWWFRFLILLLSINIVVCSMNRLNFILKIVVRKPNFDPERFRKYPNKEEFTLKGDSDKEARSIESVVTRKFGKCICEKTDNGFCLFSEKGRWSRLGVYVVHLSVLVLLLGSMLGSIYGFEGNVNIPEGEETGHIELKNPNGHINLGFQIRCDDFNVSYYDTGAPKEFRSDLVIIENGKEVLKKRIIVNDPLRYKGINIFQASFGKIPSENVTLSFTSRSSGMVYEKKASKGEIVEIPEGLGTFVLQNYVNGYNFSGHDLGATYVGVHTPVGGEPQQVVMPVKFEGFDKMRKAPVSVSVMDYNEKFYTGLQVTKDPGVWFVYLGFLFMIIGCYVAFFMSHQILCVEVVQNSKDKYRVMVSGTANKNKIGMKMKIKKIASSLLETE